MKQRKAKDSYKTATCSALMGNFLFKDGTSFSPGECEPGGALIVCIGNRSWVAAPNGLPDAFAVLENSFPGGRYADLPDDWGVVANTEGEILYRMSTIDRANPVTYLGREDGPLVNVPASIYEIGIGPRKGTQFYKEQATA